ncbi:hypothetical protein AHMF7605_27615 [Adhaeribacter arboris]|uniref:ATP-binding protein n=1 Tax=Adhaeribacter arboris TaxID=2072846 RepID=A0A2T2YNB5_9BACT|nr:ATP-binding protein [Adhaeribacter arboris]PSR56988.1 hypothetical protein AHMF7605_27615 [Adhaeribacter arboris]
MSKMNADVVGKVNNTKLSEKNGIMALFEAINNSLQSIEDAGRADGEVLVELQRAKDLYDDGKGTYLPFQNFSITDNGIGFNEENYNSFLNADSTYKINRGGKGVGRFTWLKVFQYAEVDSIFKTKESIVRRQFTFLNNKEAIADEKFSAAPNSELRTIIRLKNVRPEYARKLPRTLEAICDEIIEHLVIKLISPHCPKIIVRDTRAGETYEINLNNRFNHDFLLDKDADSFTINKVDFTIALLKVKNDENNFNHSILLSSDERVVTSTNLNQFIPNLNSSLIEIENGQSFVIKALVSSSYLDNSSNPERTKFGLPQTKKSIDSIHEISIEDIETAAAEKVEEHFDSYLALLREKKKNTMLTSIQEFFPHFAPLLQYEKIIDKISPSVVSDKNKLNLALSKAKYDILLDAKKDVLSIERTMDLISKENASEETINLYKENFEKVVNTLSDITKSELSEYVVHRRILIDIFGKLLSKKDDGTYHWEEEIHNLIFPKGHTNEDLLGAQNLWLVDERLSYHRFVASDLPFENKKDSGKPDILIGKSNQDFNIPLAYSEKNRQSAYDSMVIIEFKRPMRKGYAQDKDPIDQVKNYIRTIRNGTAEDPNGRPIEVSANCRFFAYLICDLPPKLKSDIIEMHEFTPMMEGEGLFASLKNLNTYMEVISYNKILSDSKQRNRVLFEKLGIDYND